MAAAALAALMAWPALHAQAAASGENKQNPPAAQSSPNQNPSQKQQGNPFPEDEGNVPVMPSNSAPDVSGANGDARAAAPATDSDPVRSPDEQTPGASGTPSGFSSSSSGTDDALLPPPDDERGKKKKGDDAEIEAFPKETPQEDMNVGNYYLDQKDWRGALSRFQSALVLAPDNPDVYWGLAECERHLGQFAAARDNYQKVMEYDPGSRHAKDAKKLLKDPELANAK